MATVTKGESISLTASDTSGQKVVRVAGVARNSGETVAEFIQRLVPKMGLPTADAEGRPLTYHARLDREGRHLHASEVVSEVLQNEDQVVLRNYAGETFVYPQVKGKRKEKKEKQPFITPCYGLTSAPPTP